MNIRKERQQDRRTIQYNSQKQFRFNKAMSQFPSLHTVLIKPWNRFTQVHFFTSLYQFFELRESKRRENTYI
jgi:hypothetical protein